MPKSRGRISWERETAQHTTQSNFEEIPLFPLSEPPVKEPIDKDLSPAKRINYIRSLFRTWHYTNRLHATLRVIRSLFAVGVLALSASRMSDYTCLINVIIVCYLSVPINQPVRI